VETVIEMVLVMAVMVVLHLAVAGQMELMER
jgi:hypothetical protein